MSSADDLLPDEDQAFDPLYASALREIKWIVVAWAANFTWVIGFCVFNGYDSVGTNDSSDAELRLVLGMPSWVFWGVLLPWMLATLFTGWFALTQIKDHPLEDTATEEPLDG